MFQHFYGSFTFLILALLVACSAHVQAAAQASTDSVDARPRTLDVDLNSGEILPNKKTGLANDVPGWGARVSIPTGRGTFELGGFLGRGNSIVYRTVVIDYRVDFQYDPISAHFLLGFHGDQFFQDEPNQLTKNFAGGWNFGGGTTIELVGPTFARADFLYRIGPGQVLEITVGVGYHFDTGNGT